MFKQPLIDCTLEKGAPSFDPITATFDTAEDAANELHAAETIVHDLKKMREAIAAADSAVVATFKAAFNRKQLCRRSTDEVLTEDSDILDQSNELLKAVDVQIARYQQFCDYCEGQVAELEQQERDDARYGSYADQVRGQR